mmetsp:Transcript_9326/g.32410  ORF Transcript_9326/g.32410 Transcript_9326/m.32410 type:complete len:333 (+) Transcript_9326:726-1724(+)
MSLRACPCGLSGRLGAAPTPTTTPCSLLLMLASATEELCVDPSPPPPPLVHSTSGSCTNVSSTVMSVARLALRTPSVISAHRMNTPSHPVTPRPSTRFCVRRNGTRSGSFSSRPLSKRHAKSTWTTSAVVVSSRMFSPWRSPSPTMCPTMDHTAAVWAYAVLAAIHCAGSVNLLRKKRWNTGGKSAMTLRRSSEGVMDPRSSYIFLMAWCVLERSKRPMAPYRSCSTLLRVTTFGTHSMSPQSSVRGMTAKVRRYRLRRRLSGSLASMTLSIDVNSIMRRSLRRSSLGLHRNDTALPSLPTIVSFLGRIKEFMTWTSSSKPMSVGQSAGNGL